MAKIKLVPKNSAGVAGKMKIKRTYRNKKIIFVSVGLNILLTIGLIWSLHA